MQKSLVAYIRFWGTGLLRHSWILVTAFILYFIAYFIAVPGEAVAFFRGAMAASMAFTFYATYLDLSTVGYRLVVGELQRDPELLGIIRERCLRRMEQLD